MNKACLAILALLLVSSPALLGAENEDNQGRGWALDAKAGTLGIGADLSRSIVPRVLNLRVGASFFSYSTDLREKGIDYNAKLHLGAVPVVADVFPFKNWFRIGGGVVINLNQANMTGRSSTGTVTIGDHQYNLQDIGELTTKIRFNRASPYLGLGFNNPIKRSGHWGFFVDLGILYHGVPQT